MYQSYQKNRTILESNIVGLASFDAMTVYEQLKVGVPLRLWAETDNPHDPDAVAVYYNRTKLGYLPPDRNRLLSMLLYYGNGSSLEAVISYRNPYESLDRQIRLVVRVRDARNNKAPRSAP